MITVLKNDLKTPPPRSDLRTMVSSNEKSTKSKPSLSLGFIVFVAALAILIVISWVGIKNVSDNYSIFVHSSVTIYDAQEFPKPIEGYAEKIQAASFDFSSDEIRYLHEHSVSIPFLEELSSLPRAEKLTIFQLTELHRITVYSSSGEFSTSMKVYLSDPHFESFTTDDLLLLLSHEIPVSFVKEIQNKWPFVVTAQNIVFYYRDGMTLDEFTSLFTTTMNEGI